jgi:hypothetical protein
VGESSIRFWSDFEGDDLRGCRSQSQIQVQTETQVHMQIHVQAQSEVPRELALDEV